MHKLIFSLLFLLVSANSFAADSIFKILEKYQFSNEETMDIMANYDELVDSKFIFVKPMQSIDGSLKLKLFSENKQDEYIIEKGDSFVDVERVSSTLSIEPQYFEGDIKGDIFETIMRDFQDEKLAIFLSNAFAEDFTTTKGLRVEAKYNLVLQSFYEEDELIGFGNVIKAKLIVGKAIEEKEMSKTDRVLEITLPSEEERQFTSPIGSYDFSSRFNLARRHPVKRRIQPHNGIDFRAKAGTPIHPSLEGHVIAIGRGKAKGKFIIVEHSNGMQSTYDHLKKFAKGLRVGAFVDKNDILGEVGRTGYATGAHLHFGLMKDGYYVNPIYYFKDLQLPNIAEPIDTETSDSEQE